MRNLTVLFKKGYNLTVMFFGNKLHIGIITERLLNILEEDFFDNRPSGFGNTFGAE